MGKWYEDIENKYYWKFKEGIGFDKHHPTNVFNYSEVEDFWFMDTRVELFGFRALFTEEEFAEVCTKLKLNKDFFERVE